MGESGATVHPVPEGGAQTERLEHASAESGSTGRVHGKLRSDSLEGFLMAIVHGRVESKKDRVSRIQVRESLESLAKGLVDSANDIFGSQAQRPHGLGGCSLRQG